jgi:multiple sugar transport system ATP-binding protein
MSRLSVRSLHVAFGDHVVVDDVTLDVAQGETLVLFGASGTGKTTMLRAIAGLDANSTGSVLIDGKDVSGLGPQSRDVAMAFQNFALYPHLRARDNILSPLRARSVPPVEMENRLRGVAKLLRIEHVLDHYPKALSNGQNQRTALARALIAEPAALLLDDPLRNVDAKLRYEMRQEIPRLVGEAQVAAIYVTQDYREAMALGDRIAVLDGGRVVQCAEPGEIYDRPATLVVGRLFGDPPINIIPLERFPESADLVAASQVPMTKTGSAVVLGIRPQAMSFDSNKGFPGRVITSSPIHDRIVSFVRLHNGLELLVSTPEGSGGVNSGDVGVSVDLSQVLVFDASTGRRIRTRAAA